MTIRAVRILFNSSAVALLAGCRGDSTVTPQAPLASATAKNERTLAIELTSPSRTDAGMIFTVEGPNIIDVTPAEGFDVVTNRAESKGRTTITAFVVGPLHTGVIAWLNVKGVNNGQPYDVTLTQVAAGESGGFVQRSDPGAYTLVVRR
jgi:uncharacterized lipoprotein YajG